MSDLTATNCGCSNNCNSGCGSSIIWIILLLCCSGNDNGSGIFGRNGSGCGCDSNNNSCDWLIWILLISCLCGNNGSCC